MYILKSILRQDELLKIETLHNKMVNSPDGHTIPNLFAINKIPQN